MSIASLHSRHFEFSFPRLDTLLLVEERDEVVLVRATRDTFSDMHKEAFIRELAAEGFIPDRFRWLGLVDPGVLSGVHWMIDRSWLQLSDTVRHQTRRFMFRLIGGAVVLWSVLFSLLLSGRLT